MTKVELRWPLVRPIDDSVADGLARVHSVFGIFRVRIAPTLDAVEVEYDAARLSPQDVEAALARHGIPVRRRE